MDGRTTAIMIEEGCGQDETGDDVREFYVYPIDDDGAETSPAWVTCRDYRAALIAAHELAVAHGVDEIVDL